MSQKIFGSRGKQARSTFPDFDPSWMGCKAFVENVNNSEMKVYVMANDVKTHQFLLLQQRDAQSSMTNKYLQMKPNTIT